MKAGGFIYQVEVYHREVEENDYGEQVESYKLVRKTRAAISFRNRSRSLENSSETMLGSYEMIVRQYVEIDNTTRIKYSGKWYQVIEWHEDLEYRDKVLVVEEVRE